MGISVVDERETLLSRLQLMDSKRKTIVIKICDNVYMATTFLYQNVYTWLP